MDKMQEVAVLASETMAVQQAMLARRARKAGSKELAAAHEDMAGSHAGAIAVFRA